MPQNPSDLEQLLLERQLFSRPQITGPINLPQGDPNALEAQILRFAGGMLGNQQPGDLPSALGATTSLLPLGKLVSVLNRALKGEQVVTAAKTALPEVLLDSRISGLPPTGRPPVTVVDPEDKLYEIMMERQAQRTAGQKPIRVPTNKLADGTLPKHKEVVPPYRSKSGTAVDVLGELRDADLLNEFAANHTGPGKAPPGFGHMVGYEGPTGLNAPNEAVRNLNRYDTHEGPQLVDDPVRYTAYLKSIDDTRFGQNQAEMKAAEEAIGRPLPQTTMVNDLVQALSDYFAGPRFDPFDSQDGWLRALFGDVPNKK